MLRKIVTILAVTFVIGGIYLGWVEAKKPGRFPLHEIHLEGVANTNVEQALEAIHIDKGVNLFTIDLDSVKKNLLTLPWIRSVRVKRVFPGSLTIELTEKIAVCMGKAGSQLNLLDEYGAVIKPVEVNDPLVFPVVVTANREKDRAAKVVWLINLLGRHPWLKEQVSEVVGYAGSRWVLYTSRGIKILFSENADNELELLKRLHKRYNILGRQVRQVELRIPGRVAVRMADVEALL
jgi:cell division protein FtsQ